jgi:hypothetical protein
MTSETFADPMPRLESLTLPTPLAPVLVDAGGLLLQRSLGSIVRQVMRHRARSPSACCQGMRIARCLPQV